MSDTIETAIVFHKNLISFKKEVEDGIIEAEEYIIGKDLIGIKILNNIKENIIIAEEMIKVFDSKQELNKLTRESQNLLNERHIYIKQRPLYLKSTLKEQ